MNKKFAGLLSGFMGCLLWGNVANATAIVCYDTSGGSKNATSAIDPLSSSASVSASSCGPHAGNDSVDALNGTAAGYGYDDWGFIDKIEVSGHGGSLMGDHGSLSNHGGWESGTFSFEDDYGYDQYVIVLKYGQNLYATYLSDTVATDWEWYTDYDGDHHYALSHFSVYGRSVPEPAALALLGIGLLGLTVARRRRA